MVWAKRCVPQKMRTRYIYWPTSREKHNIKIRSVNNTVRPFYSFPKVGLPFISHKETIGNMWDDVRLANGQSLHCKSKDSDQMVTFWKCQFKNKTPKACCLCHHWQWSCQLMPRKQKQVKFAWCRMAFTMTIINDIDIEKTNWNSVTLLVHSNAAKLKASSIIFKVSASDQNCSMANDKQNVFLFYICNVETFTWNCCFWFCSICAPNLKISQQFAETEISKLTFGHSNLPQKWSQNVEQNWCLFANELVHQVNFCMQPPHLNCWMTQIHNEKATVWTGMCGFMQCLKPVHAKSTQMLIHLTLTSHWQSWAPNSWNLFCKVWSWANWNFQLPCKQNIYWHLKLWYVFCLLKVCMKIFLQFK